ncbi:hypothetical protein O4J56_03530 [Nocardiopsis sp. RSe5-2]|uniref:Uncharacterized protein n=1 Tax=Nocardiopsis endophytica TaxID=3018445 RepID=A0ABT4TZP0_9ACTN|nr:hypothetical protein [Nocardiopsis endophytica]MDA2809704.1 hypothetical protein [Nocardiopsis endophytica]
MLAVAQVLEKRELMDLTEMKLTWSREGVGSIGIQSVVWIHGASTPSNEVVDKVYDSRPAGHQDSVVGRIEILGPGSWADHDGEIYREPQLIWCHCSPTDFGVFGSLQIRHDIWGWYDFFGEPHPDVYHRNAPRLASAIKGVEEVLDVELEEGEGTFFATPEKYGVAYYEPNANGKGFDVTARL